MKKPIVMCWSGGKDSALALAALRRDPHWQVVELLTTITEGYDRIAMHGVRRELLELQARALGLKLKQVRIPPQCVNDTYQQRMAEACAHYKSLGIRHMAFGDLFLQDIRDYRDAQMAKAGMTAIYPLWGRDTRLLAQDCIAQGWRAILCCVDPKQVPANLCGRDYDAQLLADLPETADPCGENGEFHTFVWDGPDFKHPAACMKAEAVLRDNFWFCDLLPEPKAAQ